MKCNIFTILNYNEEKVRYKNLEMQNNYDYKSYNCRNLTIGMLRFAKYA